ncbi:unnamed protein product [Bathycoccus prasinos]|jgi:hypothetical protein|mmetsp:Transcript_284/g.916  ORF Transcript_284/g.916 Transcript_284/m.916 type:complete len:167 (-) Transcript_284:701-1201(-)
MSATVKKKKEESEKKKKLDEPASSSSSLDVLTEGLKRSILPQIRKLDGTIANARWMQKEVTDATDRCSLEVERVISTTVGEEEEDNTTKGEREREEEEIDERLRNVLESVSKLRQRMAKVVERERAQREKLLRMRRCDLDVLRANKGEECDFEAVLRAEAYAKQQR